MTAQARVGFALGQLGRNLAAGARLAFLLPLRAHEFRVSAPQYALLVAFNLLFWVAAAALRAGFVGNLDPSAFPVYLSTVVIVLATALVVAHVYGAPERLLAFAVALSASDAVFELAGLALPAVAVALRNPELVYYAYLFWSWLVSLRAVVVIGGRRRPHLYKALAVVTLTSAFAFLWLPRADPWQEPYEEEPAPALTDEKLFHRQGELLERELAALEASRPGVELYFLGFAPDSSVDVFLREMRYVKRLFEERFGARGRALVLASSEDALDQVPIATVTSLERALRRFGRAMNPEEDVLFLFLSAHGDREHRLSSVQEPLQTIPLTPTALARMLQESGIKWRIVVVSACYSGGYVEPLRDANTIVITAAAADRVSFGCEPGRDFTYFGEAYFKEALPGAPSFVAAFERARELVAKKEAAEKLEPSMPQIWVGAALAEQLKKLAQ